MITEYNLRNTIAFLRMAAVEMRRLAERAPEIGGELNHMARQLSAEAEALSNPLKSGTGHPVDE